MNTDRVHFGVKEYFCFYFGEKEYFYCSHKILTDKNKCVVYLINYY